MIIKNNFFLIPVICIICVIQFDNSNLSECMMRSTLESGAAHAIDNSHVRANLTYNDPEKHEQLEAILNENPAFQYTRHEAENTPAAVDIMDTMHNLNLTPGSGDATIAQLYSHAQASNTDEINHMQRDELQIELIAHVDNYIRQTLDGTVVSVDEPFENQEHTHMTGPTFGTKKK